MNVSAGFQDKWEKRWHPLRGEWVVYAAHRNQRPWSGAQAPETEKAPDYDSSCYLCPGNKRIHGDMNPMYRDVFIFDNDHPVVGESAPHISDNKRETHNGLYKRAEAKGIARVVCYDPRHNVTLAELPASRAVKVFRAWREQMREFEKRPEIRFVLIFENNGEAVGVSNPHPHCQIYATDFIFRSIGDELRTSSDYENNERKNLFEAIIHAEQEDRIRVLAENEHAIAFVPFFARYAYEAMIFPKRRHATLATCSDEELIGLTQVYQTVIRKYDLNYNMNFPYVMAIHQAPVDGGDYRNYHLHFLFQPPLRQPGLMKFLAGPEIGGGNFMADTMPEEKAAELNAVDLSNYEEVS